MSDISGYRLGETIHESARSVIYRGTRESDGAPVVVKALASEHPKPDDLARFTREYEIGRSLDAPGVVRPIALERFRSRVAFVMNDDGAESLRAFVSGRDLSLRDKLRIMADLAGILGDIHQRGIIHKDVNPNNVLVRREDMHVWIIDFGISTALSRESPTIKNPSVLEGTLSYISPEQTGRVNRPMDYRTDFYSLGATFYWLLVGELPFHASTAVEMVHAHIAREPLPPHQKDPSVPEAVSRIVLRLLAKTAEERYQSGHGLRADLEECLRRLEETGAIEVFPLGRRDVSDKLNIPHKLYGREGEIASLMETFDRVSHGRAEMMLVAGYSGVGKTALVSEVHKPITERRGYFIAGKFDQLQRDIPYNSLIQAFSDLVRQLLAEPEERLNAFREKLRAALGQSGRVITDVIPEVALIIGEQPAVQELPPSEAQNRFNFVFRAFVHAFAAEPHPLVIFLDDLQWADAPSLTLIQLLLSDPSTRHLLIVGAYRDNEVDATHPLLIAVEAIGKEGGTVTSLHLAPLDLDNVGDLIAETLRCPKESCLSLSTLCFEKTHGNPFFLSQFLRSLYEEGLLSLDRKASEWRWDTTEIQRRGITDNVVELMAGKIRKLSDRTQEVLRLAACIGNHFDLKTLSLVDEHAYSETAHGIWDALREGLVIPGTGDYDLARLGSQGSDSGQVPDVTYRFLHDRVQQAAYSLIASDSRKAVHLRVGRLLLQNTAADQVDDRVFDIVHHLNLGSERITDEDERYRLAELNLTAGRKAKASAAQQPALRYLTAGLALLPEDAWEERYDLAFALHAEATEAEHVNSHFERAKELSDIALARSKTVLEKAKIYEIRVLFHTARVEYADTIRVAMETLELFGVHLPPPDEVTEKHVGAALMGTGALLAGRRAKDLVDLPLMTDEEHLAAVRMLVILAAPTYISNPMSFPLVICEMVNLSIQHGNSPLSPYCYVIYGVVLAGVLGDVDQANEYGDLALTLLDRFPQSKLRAKVYVLLALFLRHWKAHERVGKGFAGEAIQAGLEVGDLEYVGYAVNSYLTHSLYMGEPLSEVEKDSRRYLALLTRLKHEFQRAYTCVTLQMTLNLEGKAKDPRKLVGEIFDEDKTVAELLAAKNMTVACLFYVSSATLAYLFGDSAGALRQCGEASGYLNAMLGQVTVVQHNFYESLARLALAEGASQEERDAHLLRVEENQAKLAQWAASAPSNFGHKYKLVEAERQRVMKCHVEAMNAYDEAIAGATREGFVGEEALAYERAGDYYLSTGRDRIAIVYLSEARYAYQRWGAEAKVADLDRRFPGRLIQRAHQGGGDVLGTTSQTTGGVAIDLVTVMKAAQAISGEIVLDRLVDALMRSVVENAGAQRALIIVPSQGELVIEAERDASGPVPISKNTLVDGAERLSPAIVHYVERTQESVVLADAAKEGLFISDPYVAKSGARSVLCVPLNNQGKLIAILYLENNLTVGAFTSDRLEVLRILSAQAALSIHNARLYANLEKASQRLEEYSRTLEHKVEERTAELREKNEELGATLTELRTTQRQLVTQEKLASLGALTAGIAHEIRNPLNFINNFAQLSADFADELAELIAPAEPTLGKETFAEIETVLGDLRQNSLKINEHGKRADVIVNGMLMHSRETAAERTQADLNAVLAEAVTLTYHGVRAREPELSLKIDADYDDAVGMVEMASSEISRVFVNIINNACYATKQKRTQKGPSFTPQLTVRTKSLGEKVEVRIRDNGGGIPSDILDKVFHPFFTTKPPGEGTGLGLSLSHEIVVEGHQGELRVDTEPGQFTELILTLPRRAAPRSVR